MVSVTVFLVRFIPHFCVCVCTGFYTITKNLEQQALLCSECFHNKYVCLATMIFSKDRFHLLYCYA